MDTRPSAAAACVKTSSLSTIGLAFHARSIFGFVIGRGIVAVMVVTLRRWFHLCDARCAIVGAALVIILEKPFVVEVGADQPAWRGVGSLRRGCGGWKGVC
jgi:hypothetical protein